MEGPSFDVQALLSPPDIMQCKRVLCVQPHPDDNEVGMGSIIALLADAGCEVHYLTVTNGDQGNKDKTATPEQTAATRRVETEAAGRHLGAKFFHYLERGDGTLCDILPLSIEIASVIRSVKPDAIFGPDPWLRYEGHLDHIITGRAFANAFELAGRIRIADSASTAPHPVGMIGYYFTETPNVIYDVTSTFERKFEAIALHDSQMEAETLAMFRIYFGMRAQQMGAAKGFALGEGLRVLRKLHTHCFAEAATI